MASFELRLDEPIEQLVPKMIGFNNAELMTRARDYLEKYKGKTYDDKSMAEAKADRAEINKVKLAINGARIDISKVYEAPYKAFKAQIDEVIEVLDEVGGDIDKQVKDYEAKNLEEKMAEIEDYFNGCCPEELKPFVKFENIKDRKWNNISCKLKSIQAEIEAKFIRIRDELATITALESEDEAQLKALYFRTMDLSQAISEGQRLKGERERILAAEAKKKEVEEPKQIEIPIQQETQAASKERTQMTVKFQVTESVEKLWLLRKFLQENNIAYEAIK